MSDDIAPAQCGAAINVDSGIQSKTNKLIASIAKNGDIEPIVKEDVQF